MGIITGELIKKRLPFPHDLEYEKTYWPFLILTKKRYVGNKYEFNPDKYKQDYNGIVLKRRDNAPIVKHIYGGVVNIILKHHLSDEFKQVLAENPDLQVMVEGHTDADAFNGRTAVKDNWDLSVMRATSIVKILVANEGVNKANITAAGRSEYVPVASNDTPEGKAKNRRTEIIITPNLSELNQLLEMN